MIQDEEYEFKKPEEEILPGEETEETVPNASTFPVAGVISAVCGALSLLVFLPRLFYLNYYSFAVTTPESLGATVFSLAGIASGIVALVKPKGKVFWRYLGFWANMLAVLIYLGLAFFHLFFDTDLF